MNTDTSVLGEYRLRELIEVGHDLVAELDQEVVLRRAVEAVRRLTGARHAVLGIPRGDGADPERLLDRGIDVMSREAIAALPRGHGILVVPIEIRGHAWGEIYLLAKEECDFDEADEQSARILAEWAAIGVENARRYAAVGRQRDNLESTVKVLEASAVETARIAAASSARHSLEAEERERGRWARELHDESLQTMAGLRVILSAARRAGDPAAVDQMLGRAIGQVDATIAGMRRLIADLRPATLDELGLRAALESLVERLRWADVLDVSLLVEIVEEEDGKSVRFVAQTEDAVYRLVQEALTNVAKHAEVRRATVEVVEVGDEIGVLVEDRGCGFETDKAGDGFGLAGMRERVELAGGSLAVRSTLGVGTAITAVLPAHRR